MPIFAYTALDNKGQEKRDQLEAADTRDAVSILRRRGLYVSKIIECKEDLATRIGKVRQKLTLRELLGYLLPWRYLPVMSGNLVRFFRETALMLRAGHPLVTSLETSAVMTQNVRFRRTLNKMSRKIREGMSLSGAMAEEKRIFSVMVTRLIASGEQGGHIDSVLERLAESLERSKDLKTKLLAALLYPSIVFLGGMGVTLFLVMFIIPRFAEFLQGRSSQLPAATQMLLDIADYAEKYGLQIAVVVGSVVFFFLALYTFKPGKRVIDLVILWVPILGGTVTYSAMAQAGWNLSMLLRSGVTVFQALQIVSETTGNLGIADSFSRASDRLLEGNNIATALEGRCITDMMRHMASVGESSGQLDNVMEEVGAFYQKELEVRVNLMSTMIEPVLLLGVGGVVGFVYYAFFKAITAVSMGGM